MGFVQKYGKYLLILLILFVGWTFYSSLFGKGSSINLFSDDWVETEAVVVELKTRWDSNSDGQLYFPTVEFMAGGNKIPYKVSLNTDVSSLLYSVGSDITISYNKNNPYQAEKASSRIYMFIIAIAILLILIVLLIPPLRKRVFNLVSKVAKI